MKTYYQILQWTPFPNKYLPIPEWQLQEAEYELHLNKTHYYEHAKRTKKGITYPPETAQQIINYWKERWSFAKYKTSVVRMPT